VPAGHNLAAVFLWICGWHQRCGLHPIKAVKAKELIEVKHEKA
jgi:hypothetical protein